MCSSFSCLQLSIWLVASECKQVSLILDATGKSGENKTADAGRGRGTRQYRSLHISSPITSSRHTSSFVSHIIWPTLLYITMPFRCAHLFIHDVHKSSLPCWENSMSRAGTILGCPMVHSVVFSLNCWWSKFATIAPLLLLHWTLNAVTKPFFNQTSSVFLYQISIIG